MSASVFPARAGVSRERDEVPVEQRRVPRASGGEPHNEFINRDDIMCSPRERG